MKKRNLTTILVASCALLVAFGSLNAQPTAELSFQADEQQPPSSSAERPRIEAVFVLDTTGSMSGLIQAAKDNIWSIATTMASAEPTPDIHIGLVAYRDRGDEYITRLVPMTNDLDTVYSQLMSFQASGGGDMPESVNQALFEAVHEFPWSSDPNTYRVIFLVGDAPPHMDYDEVQYPEIVASAMGKGIFVNTIQCGGIQETTPHFMTMAQLGEGNYFAVEQGGGAITASTPFDEELAQLARELDATRIFFGSTEELQVAERRNRVAGSIYTEASVAAQARRASFNTTASGTTNFLGENELVNAWQNNPLILNQIEASHLPPEMQTMSADQREEHLRTRAERRQALTSRIRSLNEQRQAHLREVARELAASGATVLDDAIYGTVRRQASSASMEFSADHAAY